MHILQFLVTGSFYSIVDGDITGALRDEIHEISLSVPLLQDFDVRLLEVHDSLLAQLLKDIREALINWLNGQGGLPCIFELAIETVQVEPLFIQAGLHIPRQYALLQVPGENLHPDHLS